MNYLLVFIGSGIGGMCRHGVGALSLRWFGPGFPYGTLTINIVGSTLMGVLIGLFAAFDIGTNQARLFIATGLIGGFTTFSTYSLDAVTLWERGETGAAIGYVVVSVILSLLGLFLAMLAMRRLG